MSPLFFSNRSDFRKWLEENHLTETELFVGFYKVNSGKPSITYPESVDEALCFGWIDGVRRSIDKDSYCNRFTPRRLKSNWSNVNIQKVKTLTQLGLMQPAGLKAFNQRKIEKTNSYSFENENREFPEDFRNRLMANKRAWDYFYNQAPSYQKTIVHWVMAARREETRLARLDKTIRASEKQQRLM